MTWSLIAPVPEKPWFGDTFSGDPATWIMPAALPKPVVGLNPGGTINRAPGPMLTANEPTFCRVPWERSMMQLDPVNVPVPAGPPPSKTPWLTNPAPLTWSVPPAS